MMTCQCETIPAHLQAASEELERVTGLKDFRAHIMEAGSLVVRGQQLLAKVERARSLELGELPGANFERQFQMASRSARRARRALRTASQSESWNEMRAAVNPSGAAFGESLSEVRGLFAESMLDAETSATTVAEFMGVYDEVVNNLRSGGVDGLVDFVDQQLAELDRVLVAERDWGREAHSPLTWYEWLFLAWLLSSSVFGILACWWWSDCSWVRAVLGWMCEFVRVTGGLQWAYEPCRSIARQIGA
jgi:hypothetical protein